MAAQRWSLEVKVGAFIVSGICLLIFFVFAIGDLSMYWQARYRVRVLFDSANGITEGSPVQYAGVEVGKVHRVQIHYPEDRSTPKVELIVGLPSSITVRSDDQVAISTFGLLGEKYLEITPGAGQGAILEPDGQLIGKPPVSTERIMERSNQVLTELQQTLQGINSLVADPEAHVYLKEAIIEARDATRNWKALAERLNIAMSYAESGQGNLGKFLYDEDLYQRVVLFVDDVRAHPWKLLIRSKTQQSAPSTQHPDRQ